MSIADPLLSTANVLKTTETREKSFTEITDWNYDFQTVNSPFTLYVTSLRKIYFYLGKFQFLQLAVEVGQFVVLIINFMKTFPVFNNPET